MEKGFVYLVGAGPGDPELITVKALNALTEAECIIYDYLANPRLIEEFDCEKIYVGKSGTSHTLTQEQINQLLVDKALEGKIVVRLKGGDPMIFGRGGEEAEELVNAGIPFSVVPGISSFYSAPTYAGIPLTHRDHSNALEVITGHRRSDAKNDDTLNLPVYDPDRTYTFLMGVKNLGHIASTLIKEKNFPGDTPVALISWGTRPDQRVVTGLLKNIVDIVKSEEIKPPAVTVIGSVVALRDRLRWFDNQPLFGKRIVVTRTRAKASRLSRQLLRLGADVIEFPTIDIEEEEDFTPLKNAISKIDEFSWLFLTSQNTVTILFNKLFSMDLDSRVFGGIKIAVIGPATGDELIKYGIRPDLVPEEYVAEGLLKEAAKLNIKGQKVLLPCSADARDVLADGLGNMGANVERIHIYKAIQPKEISSEVMDDVRNADIITFASSSTVKNFFNLVPEIKGMTACIGPVTADTLRELNITPDIIAEEYTIKGLIKAMVEHFKRIQ